MPDRRYSFVAVDREIGRQGDVARLARRVEVEIAVERAVEQRGEEPLSRDRAPGRALPDTSDRARPRFAASVFSASPTLLGRQVPQRQDQLPPDAGIGVGGHAEQARRGVRARAASLCLGSLYSTWPFSRSSRPRIRTACSRIRGSVLQGSATAAADRRRRRGDPEHARARSIGLPVDERPDASRSTTFCGSPSARSISRAARRPAWRRPATSARRSARESEKSALVSRLCSLGDDAVDPAGGLVAECVAADARVVPIGHEHRAVGRGGHVHGAEPGVVAGEEHLVIGAEHCALADDREQVDLPSAGVGLEPPAVFGGNRSPS